MNRSITLISLILLGFGAGVISTNLFSTGHKANEASVNEEKKPLYWVAPMDSNYRRDSPGKSPMGMDLVPVYEENDSQSVGTVKISPEVVNNLGVRTITTTKASLHDSIKTVGYVQYDEDSLLHIHPRVEGWIETLYVKAAGDPVKANTPLYTLYSPELVNAQEEFLIAINRNNQALINASKARLQALQLSPSFIEKLASERKVKQSITFYTPQSGVIDGMQVREGFYVKPGTTLMSIGQLDTVWVEAEVFERDAAKIHLEQPVTMTLDYLPGRSWEGKVNYIYPTVEAKTRTLRVRLKFANPDLALKPNMFAAVQIHTSSTQQHLIVPKEAVIRTGSQDRVVLAKGDGRFKSVEVQLGLWGKTHVEILSGLAEGDEIVTSAQFLIDSESSKTSDFKRMETSANTLWIAGEIRQLDTENRVATIKHEAAPDWGWPEMTMDFNLDERVDVKQLAVGQSLHFEVTKQQDGSLSVTGIHVMGMAEKTYPSAEVGGIINSIDIANRTLNISRDAIEKWDRPAATMDFLVADDIDMNTLSPNMSVQFRFEIQDDFVVVEIMPQQSHAGH
ncbi:efflux RND transporter periplasmic adaptor subunit (plasmid) [Pseudoalteromonas xiamenensis]|uniref:efflux RND transporter periplasmic adaptor subunit n=1 Tax=Pseudoalteromonas xiamenensis TaxID=882626 RepID=UPI0027E4BAC0|nr:efflux RND transporter periplasmic adaptor subunit [Pseudoalteromonas xiamenensis]WMN61840.1 efflux RND transporter periplasmic adaptor subunit [Pseudoalteromonas xiamenensis]